MAEIVENHPTLEAEAAPEKRTIRFGGSSRNMVPGVALLFASALAFSMGMTDTFFAEATAWTFLIWGALLVWSGMADVYRVVEITDEAFVVNSQLNFWSPARVYEWERINRMDIVIKRRNARAQDAEVQVYYTPPGELAMLREDNPYDPELARLVVERAGLRPADKANPTDFTQLPLEQKAVYIWQK
jgi:hypothetical protein